jgi:hypothetical protein
MLWQGRLSAFCLIPDTQPRQYVRKVGRSGVEEEGERRLERRISKSKVIQENLSEVN